MANIFPTLMAGETLDMSVMQNGFVSFIGVILAVCVLNLLFNKVTAKDPKDKKTDWFFQEEKYDRKLDERADKNQYRNY